MPRQRPCTLSAKLCTLCSLLRVHFRAPHRSNSHQTSSWSDSLQPPNPHTATLPARWASTSHRQTVGSCPPLSCLSAPPHDTNDIVQPTLARCSGCTSRTSNRHKTVPSSPTYVCVRNCLASNGSVFSTIRFGTLHLKYKLCMYVHIYTRFMCFVCRWLGPRFNKMISHFVRPKP